MLGISRAAYVLPLLVMATGIAGVVSGQTWLQFASVSIGIGKILLDSVAKLRRKSFALDYVAFMAMVTSIASGNLVAGAVVAFMITGGEALEEYAEGSATQSLRALAERIPKTALVITPAGNRETLLREVVENEVIIIKPNAVVPLDGFLQSAHATIEASALTGEALPVELSHGAFIKSGVINAGELITLKVSGTFETSTYARLVSLVEEAKARPARIVRMAEVANFPFTAITIVIAAIAYAVSHDLSRLLAVLVIATPCPLIIAAPTAFIGALSRAARHNIIVRTPSALEALARVKTIFFDKTGTLTLGEPRFASIEARVGTEEEVLAIVAGIEFHSLHPVARAIVKEAMRRSITIPEATHVEEELGRGIAGTVLGARYSIRPVSYEHSGIVLEILKQDAIIGHLRLDDVLKEGAARFITRLSKQGYEIAILTGDNERNAHAVLGDLSLSICADCTPDKKTAYIREAKSKGVVAMVGDGLNDAPALAEADVGIVFSGSEQSAATEAAHIIVLGSSLRSIGFIIAVAKRARLIALQSIIAGIVLSTIGMIAAAFGLIPPITGALIQEAIDVAVILNALRAAR